MSVENVTYINHLNPEWPTPADFISEGDDHIRSTKKGLKNSFPNVAGAVTATHGEMNHLVGVTSPIQGQINGKAASTVTADLQTQVNAKADKTTTDDLQTQINAKASQSTADSLQTQINAKAVRAGDTYTGTHDFSGASITLATPPLGDSSNKPATTAFVASTAMSSALPGQTGNAGKVLGTDGTNASWGHWLPPMFWTTYTWNPDGTLATATAGGVTSSYAWYADGRLNTISTPTQVATYNWNAINPQQLDGVTVTGV